MNCFAYNYKYLIALRINTFLDMARVIFLNRYDTI